MRKGKEKDKYRFFMAISPCLWYTITSGRKERSG